MEIHVKMVGHVLKEEFLAALYAGVKKGTVERHAKVKDNLLFTFPYNSHLLIYIYLISRKLGFLRS